MRQARKQLLPRRPLEVLGTEYEEQGAARDLGVFVGDEPVVLHPAQDILAVAKGLALAENPIVDEVLYRLVFVTYCEAQSGLLDICD